MVEVKMSTTDNRPGEVRGPPATFRVADYCRQIDGIDRIKNEIVTYEFKFLRKQKMRFYTEKLHN